LAQEHNIQIDNSILMNEEMKKIILNEINIVCKRAKLSGFEIPKQIILTDKPFTIENGMLTATMKTMRNCIRNNWESHLNNLYENKTN